MILVIGTAVVKPGSREAATERCVWMSRLTEREPGCRSYRFYTDLTDPDTMLIVEEWESGEALRAHFGTPHMAEFSRALAGLVASPPIVTRYVVSSVGPL